MAREQRQGLANQVPAPPTAAGDRGLTVLPACLCAQVRAARPAVASRKAVVGKAQQQSVAPAVAAAALATIVGFSNVQPAAADVAGLTPCSESKAFAKLQKKEVKNLEKRLKKVNGGPAAIGGWRQARGAAAGVEQVRVGTWPAGSPSAAPACWNSHCAAAGVRAWADAPG